MSKKIKVLMEQELASRYGELSECLVVSLQGMTGNENNELRAELKNQGIHLNVVKNSLARRAFLSSGQPGAGSLFTGPCAVVYGGDNIVDVAKAVTEWTKKIESLRVKGALLEGEALNALQAAELAKMPSRQELQGQVVQLALSPGSRLASQLGSPASRIAGCIEALVKRMEEAA
jgi:large subunit ribosomal protein L10